MVGQQAFQVLEDYQGREGLHISLPIQEGTKNRNLFEFKRQKKFKESLLYTQKNNFFINYK